MLPRQLYWKWVIDNTHTWHLTHITVVYFAGTNTTKQPSPTTTSYSPTATLTTTATTSITAITIITTTPITQTVGQPSEDDTTDMESAASSTQSTGLVKLHGRHCNILLVYYGSCLILGSSKSGQISHRIKDKTSHSTQQ